jgi:hypothetical protein
MAFRSKFTGEQIDALLDLIEPETTYKFYDCFWGDENNDHSGYYEELSKVVDMVTGETVITPEARIDTDNNTARVAIAFDMAKKIYIDGKWITNEEFLKRNDYEGFDFNAHPEITEEEFYHIPEDEYYYETPEDAEKLFNRVDAILERGRQMGLSDGDFSNIPLTPWIKMINRNEDYTIENLPFNNANLLYEIYIKVIGGGEYNGWENIDIVKKYEFGQFTSTSHLRTACMVCQATSTNGENKYWFEHMPH